MEVNSVGCGSALTPEVQAQYAAKLIKMAQGSTEVAGTVLEDIAEISQQAMQRYLAELK